MPKELVDYEREFLHDVMGEKYKRGTVTPAIFKKEILKFMKSKMSAQLIIDKGAEFLNEMALDMTQTPSFSSNRNFAQNSNLFPIHFLDGLLSNNIMSKEVRNIISSKITAREYEDYCDHVVNDKVSGSEKTVIQDKINKFKIVESCKPTGNAFTRFFKRLFNIGGYNQKMEAYNNCRQSIKELVGDKLSDIEFEHFITSDQRLSIEDFQEPVKRHKPIEVKEVQIDEIQTENVKLTKEPELEKDISFELTK